MDKYTEQIIVKKPDGMDRLKIALCILVIIVGVLSILFYDFGIGVAIVAVGGFLCYWANTYLKSEYEYLFINGDCDVARIINQSSRKDVYSFKESDVTRVLPYNSDKFQNEIEINDKLSLKNLTSGNKDNTDSWYAFLTNSGKETVAVILELNEKNIEHVNDCYKNKLN